MDDVVIVDIVNGPGFKETLTGVGFASGQTVRLNLTGKNITAYRFRPSAPMRVAEDAYLNGVYDVTTAESWLQVGVSPLAGEVKCEYPVATGEWSQVRRLKRGEFFTDLTFSLDNTGSGATVEVDCK